MSATKHMGLDGQPCIEIYDTTLRDGAQAETVAFTVEDKLKITYALDDFGVDFIEGGWPGSNPRDEKYFKAIKAKPPKQAKVVAFGSTRAAKSRPEDDANLRALINAEPDAMAIVGKTWDVHVTDALRITLAQNLAMIEDSLAHLRPCVKTLLFDAEHFFDGFKRNRNYALDCLRAAVRGGADYLVLCDTNGGALPQEIAVITAEVKALFPEVKLAIHAHNDAELAVANSLAGIGAGAVQVQGTINGLGERCGNANMCSILPAISLKMKLASSVKLEKLYEISHLVAELANVGHNPYQPYVGRSAFAHKGGIHISAVTRNPETYEHVRPESVGNAQRILVSELAGKSAILHKAEQYGLDITSDDEAIKKIVAQLKEMEARDFQYEGAEASFELLVRRALGQVINYFEVIYFLVNDHKIKDEMDLATAIITIKVGDGPQTTSFAEGNGPVNALDAALRKALESHYEVIKKMHLVDYKVRVLPEAGTGTGAKVRVLIDSSDHTDTWSTVGVSHDIIEASWQALLDSVNYMLYRDQLKKAGHAKK